MPTSQSLAVCREQKLPLMAEMNSPSDEVCSAAKKSRLSEEMMQLQWFIVSSHFPP